MIRLTQQKDQFHPKPEKCGSFGSKSRFRVGQKKPKCLKNLLKLFVFGIENFCEFLLLHINNLHGIFNSVLTRFFAISIRFITTISKKDYQKHNHYSQTGSEKNKSQNRPKRIQREQTLLFGATMHDFSK